MVSRMRLKYFLAGLVWAAAPMTVSAQIEGDVGVSSLEILVGETPWAFEWDFLSRGLVVRDDKGNVRQSWKDIDYEIALASIPAGQPVQLSIINANTLNYVYNVQTEIIRHNTNTNGCSETLIKFGSASFLIGTASVASFTGLFAFEDPAGVIGQSMYNLELPGQVSGLAGNTSQLAFLRSETSKLTNETLKFSGEVSNYADSLAVVARRADFVPISTLLNGMEANMEARYRGITRRTSTFEIVEDLILAHEELLSIIQKTNARSLENDQQTALVSLEQELTESRTSLDEIRDQHTANLDRIQGARRQSARKYLINNPEGHYVQVRVITEAGANSVSTSTPRSGQVTFYSGPQSPAIECSLGIGLSWINRSPQYEIDSDDVLSADRLDSKRIAPSLMLGFSHRKLPVLSALLGVGVGNQGAPDLYTGLQVKVLGALRLTVGSVFQREIVKPRGLREGEVVTGSKLSVSDFDKQFRSKLFFGMTFSK